MASNALLRRRLDPDVRRNLILDETANLVARAGVAAVSMERVAREAGVSKALVYAYFRNQTSLLQALLLRDHKRLWEHQLAAAKTARDFAELIATTTGVYLRHAEANGLHLERLLGEPTIAAAFEVVERREQRQVVEFLAAALHRAHGVPLPKAALAIELSMGMTGAAGQMVARREVTREAAEDLVLCLFRGSIKSLQEEYGPR